MSCTQLTNVGLTPFLAACAAMALLGPGGFHCSVVVVSSCVLMLLMSLLSRTHVLAEPLC